MKYTNFYMGFFFVLCLQTFFVGASDNLVADDAGVATDVFSQALSSAAFFKYAIKSKLLSVDQIATIEEIQTDAKRKKKEEFRNNPNNLSRRNAINEKNRLSQIKKEREKRYRQNHREAILKKEQCYREKHREILLEKSRLYYAKRRELRLERKRLCSENVSNDSSARKAVGVPRIKKSVCAGILVSNDQISHQKE